MWCVMIWNWNSIQSRADRVKNNALLFYISKIFGATLHFLSTIFIFILIITFSAPSSHPLKSMKIASLFTWTLLLIIILNKYYVYLVLWQKIVSGAICAGDGFCNFIFTKSNHYSLWQLPKKKNHARCVSEVCSAKKNKL